MTPKKYLTSWKGSSAFVTVICSFFRLERGKCKILRDFLPYNFLSCAEWPISKRITRQEIPEKLTLKKGQTQRQRKKEREQILNSKMTEKGGVTYGWEKPGKREHGHGQHFGKQRSNTVFLGWDSFKERVVLDSKFNPIFVLTAKLNKHSQLSWTPSPYLHCY